MNKAKKLLKTIKESSLSRIYDNMKNHDCGVITGWRTALDCGDGTPYTRKEKKQRNKSLFAKLLNKRYHVISMRGKYIENIKDPNAKETGERVFFVVDSDDKGNLKKDIIKLGVEFDQDSVLFVPKGGEKAILIGTNHCPKATPGWGKEEDSGEKQDNFLQELRADLFYL